MATFDKAISMNVAEQKLYEKSTLGDLLYQAYFVASKVPCSNLVIKLRRNVKTLKVAIICQSKIVL